MKRTSILLSALNNEVCNNQRHSGRESEKLNRKQRTLKK